MISRNLAKRIINKVRNLLEEDLIVVDTTGTIIASTDEQRVGHFHEGAVITCRKQVKVIISKADESTLKGVKAGINLPIFFNEQIIGVIGITGDPEQVSGYGELLQKMTELLVKESYYFEQREWEARTRELFVFDWMKQEQWSDSFLHQSTVLGVDISVDRQVIIGYYKQPEVKQLSTDIWTDVIKQYSEDDEDIFVRWGTEQFLILRAGHKSIASTKRLLQQIQSYFAEQYQQAVLFGVGQVIEAKQLFQSFKQAERALQLAKGERTVVFDEELQLEICLQEVSLATRIELVERTIRPLLTERELLETLKLFITLNQSIKKTAEALHIHINTLHYRLKKIENVTSLNPRDFHHLTTLSIALTFLEDYLKNNYKNALFSEVHP
ncbi:CdaR family transcriptional regulator [Oceanobacillus jeddahense]|uniref:Helix-turn-helix domain-containing protein n=1 Tax=Oceanobacillus jeddahense TaxID=1462527 RepID=A0ABY5JU46_9BACI|nr:sugar diacid recognition domain-containing protein [Oceanobacillus jeddahense]UUI03689.1 helix-turn-helix domain-containing protein [Oceanobacillus jeddahense]